MYFIWWCILGLCHEYLPGHVSVDSELGMTADKGSGLDLFLVGFPGGSDGKEYTCDIGDPGSIPGVGRCPGEGNGNPLQYFCLENSMDRGAWQATVHGVSESDTTEWLSLNLCYISLIFCLYADSWKLQVYLKRKMLPLLYVDSFLWLDSDHNHKEKENSTVILNSN